MKKIIQNSSRNDTNDTLIDKDIRAVIWPVCLYKKVEERLTMLSREVIRRKKDQNQITRDENYNVWHEKYM